MNYKQDYSQSNLIVAINPRYPFSKVGVYNNNKLIFLKKINHQTEQIKFFRDCNELTLFRKDAILKELVDNGIPLDDIKVVIARGGLTKPVKSGVYFVNENIVKDLGDCKMGKDIVNLGGLIADAISKELPNARAFIADSVVVDEYEDIAKVTGLPELPRRSIFHALNQKAIARKYAKSIGKKYEELNLIIAHLGTGITVGAHRKGLVIDSNMGYDGDGPFAPIRAGSLPTGDLIRLCFSGKYTQDELLAKVSIEGGIRAHLGTYSAEEVDKRVQEGDQKAAFIFEAMAYQVSKTIGSMYPVLNGDVDAILITGGIAHSQWFVRKIMERVSKLAQIVVFPGSDDIETLAMRGLAVINGDEEVLEY
jgi:butyrate kinase